MFIVSVAYRLTFQLLLLEKLSEELVGLVRVQLIALRKGFAGAEIF